MKDIHPLGDMVMVQVDKSVKERNGIIVSQELQPDIAEGEVVAYGPDVDPFIEQDIKVSSRGVIYAALDHEANSYEQDGERFLFIRVKDLMGTIFLGSGNRFPRIQSALGRWALMEWEEAKNTLLGGLLIRPVQEAKAHFTGKVILHGANTHELEPGKRYFFEQFSDFKSWEEGGKRYAFVPESAVYCEIPEREADVCLAPSEVTTLDLSEAMR